MKITKILFVLILIQLFYACKKKEIASTPETLEILKDSCSYTIDGKTYTFSGQISSQGRGLYEANIDSATCRANVDSLLYFTHFTLRSSLSNDTEGGFIKLNFIKKYHNNQLTATRTFIPSPPSDLPLYDTGYYQFARDFGKNNFQEGIALSVYDLKEGKSEHFYTHTTKICGQRTTINFSNQESSSFRITKFVKLKNNSYQIEAFFNATVFSNNETPKNLEKGYVRFIIP